ncbi:hypothetical protein [uncultured Roseibium sp.]|uniref:hypothetical protein n=1 Tax=uncultured Roseibium sp. TaxID=1936171 RepID=UPI002631113A|nr:hypothetical protein [uncultured Roseibium sp.]
MSDQNWNWTPGVGVGPLKFGVSIDDNQTDLDLKLLVPEGGDASGWATYEVGGPNKTISTENGKIESIQCEDYFGYKNENLIGMSEAELVAHMGEEPYEIGVSVEYDNGVIETPFEYDNLALIAWSADGKIVSASAHEIVDD